MAVEGLGVWAYAVACSLDPGLLAGVTGVDGEPVHTVEDAGLIAIVDSVDLGGFGEEPLRRHLEDLDWLATTARAHDAVIDVVVGFGPAVPMRLATVYLHDGRVRELLTKREHAFRAALRRVTGRTEWGVKVYADPHALAGPEHSARAEAESGARGPGTAYLLRRRAQLSAREAAEQRAAAHGQDTHDTLGRIAAASKRHPPQDPRLTGDQRWMVLNGAYLVDDQRTDEFAAAVAALGDEHQGVRLELTGPWPPYSFAGVDKEQAGE